jgi:hypothetical protein
MSAKEIEFLLAIETMPEAYQPEADREGKPIVKAVFCGVLNGNSCKES